MASLLLALALAAAPVDGGETAAPGGGKTLRLDRTIDGGWRHRDRDAGFEATIHADGRVTFRHVAPIRFEVRGGDGKPIGKREDEDPAKRPPTPPEIMPPSSFGPLPVLLGLGGRFGGLRDIGTRKTLAKRRFMQQTAELRAKLAAESRVQREREALFVLANELASMWKDDRRSVPERRRALFETWDDCDEGGAGVRARERIEAFVREHVNGAVGFTKAELVRLNAGRRSRGVFDPYGGRVR